MDGLRFRLTSQQKGRMKCLDSQPQEPKLIWHSQQLVRRQPPGSDLPRLPTDWPSSKTPPKPPAAASRLETFAPGTVLPRAGLRVWIPVPVKERELPPEAQNRFDRRSIDRIG